MSEAKMGRPLKFQSVAELQQKIDEYFADCDPHIGTHKIPVEAAEGKKITWADREYITEQKPYTVTGLAMALGTSRETLLDYESGNRDSAEKDGETLAFSDTVKAAKQKCQWYAEQHLFSGKNATGAIFSLKNNYGWVDKQLQEHSGGFFDGRQRIEVELVNPEVPGDETPPEPDAEPSAPSAS